MIPAQCRYGKLRRKVGDKSECQLLNIVSPEQDIPSFFFLKSAQGRFFYFKEHFKNMKKKIIILSSLLIIIFCIFFLFSKFKTSPDNFNLKNTKSPALEEKINSNIKDENIENIKEKLEFTYQEEAEISVYDFMQILAQEGKITFKEKNYAGMGKFITEINNLKNDEKSWIYYINGIKANLGVSNYQIKKGDVLFWKHEKENF